MTTPANEPVAALPDVPAGGADDQSRLDPADGADVVSTDGYRPSPMPQTNASAAESVVLDVRPQALGRVTEVDAPLVAVATAAVASDVGDGGTQGAVGAADVPLQAPGSDADGTGPSADATAVAAGSCGGVQGSLHPAVEVGVPQQPSGDAAVSHDRLPNAAAAVPTQRTVNTRVDVTPAAAVGTAVTAADLRAVVRPVVQTLAGFVVALTVLTGVVASLTLDDGHGGGLADWLRTAVAVLALAVGGSVGVSVSLSGDEGGASFAAGGRVLPLALSGALLFVVGLISARAERNGASATPRQLGTRALLTGGLFATALSLLALFSRTSHLYGYGIEEELDVAAADVTAGARVVATFIGGFLLVGAAAAVGRLQASPTKLREAPLAARFGSKFTILHVDVNRGVAGFLTSSAAALAAVVSVVGLVYLVYMSLFTDEIDGMRLRVVAALVLGGVNAVGYGLLFVLGVPLTYTGSGSSAGGFLGFGESTTERASESITLLDSKRFCLLVLIPVLVGLACAVRRTLRESHALTIAHSKEAYRSAAVLGACGAFSVALLLRASSRVTGHGEIGFGALSGSAEVHVGPSLLWAPLIGAAWAVGLLLALRMAPTVALSLPRMARRLGGGRMSPTWSSALAGSGVAPSGARSSAVRLSAGVLAAIMGLALIGGTAIFAFNALFNTPSRAAEHYLDSLSRGDVAAVLAAMEQAPDRDRQPLLQDEVLRHQDVRLLNDIEIKSVDVDGTTATATATYKITGSVVSETIALSASEKKRFGLFRTWRVTQDLPVLTFAQNGTLPLLVAGVQVPAGEYVAFPGSYVIRGGEHDLLSATPATVRVASHLDTVVQLQASLKPEVRSAVDDAVNARLDECAAATSIPLLNCPFLVDAYYMPDNLSNISLKITQRPVWTPTYDAESGQVRLVTDRTGQVTLSGTQRVEWFFGEAEDQPLERTYDFGVDAAVYASDGQVTVTFDE